MLRLCPPKCKSCFSHQAVRPTIDDCHTALRYFANGVNPDCRDACSPPEGFRRQELPFSSLFLSCSFVGECTSIAEARSSPPCRAITLSTSPASRAAYTNHTRSITQDTLLAVTDHTTPPCLWVPIHRDSRPDRGRWASAGATPFQAMKRLLARVDPSDRCAPSG